MRKSELTNICKYCSTIFNVAPWQLKIGHGKFCSRACTDKGKDSNRGNFQKGHTSLNSRDVDKWVTKICACGESFESLITRDIKFCGKICRYKYRKGNGPHSEETKLKIKLAHKRIHTGHPERATNWKGGVSFVPGYKSLMKKKSRLNTLGSHTKDEWEQLKLEYGNICPACHRKEPEIQLTQDHIISLSSGGDDYIDNIQPLCKSCNSRKNFRTIRYDNPLMELNNAAP